MSGAEILAEAVAAIRWEAALELVRAVDTITLLEQCERATGRTMITEADRGLVKDARRRWIGVRA